LGTIVRVQPDLLRVTVFVGLKLRIELLPLPGEELQTIVKSVQDLSPELMQKIKAMYPN
jgi:hypothetical protein